MLACIGSWASEAQAETPRWLGAYEVHAACPSRASFEERVGRRVAGSPDVLERLRVAVAIQREARAHGAVEDGAATWRAVLRVTDLEQHTATHEVADPSCSALVDALSLLVALSGDAAPRPAPAASELPATLEGEASAAMDSPTHESGHKAGAAFGAGVAVVTSVRSGVGPTPSLGIGVGGALEWSTEGWWAPRVELSLSRFESSEVRLPGDVEMRFVALFAVASACPLRLLGADAWSLRPCLDLELGQLTGLGSGRAVVGQVPRRSPWLAAGASLRLHVVPLRVAPLQLGAALGASLPAYRHEFYFSPDIEEFVVPSVAWNAAATLAWSF